MPWTSGNKRLFSYLLSSETPDAGVLRSAQGCSRDLADTRYNITSNMMREGKQCRPESLRTCSGGGFLAPSTGCQSLQTAATTPSAWSRGTCRKVVIAWNSAYSRCIFSMGRSCGLTGTSESCQWRWTSRITCSTSRSTNSTHL